MTLEVGYIYRRITHEYQPVELNPVPYMMTLGGQQFKQAYDNVLLQYCGGLAGMAGGGCANNAAAVTPQPFFETALKGTGYCNAFANGTAAVVANEGKNLGNVQVWSLWSDLDSGVGCPSVGCTDTNGNVGAFNFPRSLQSTPIPGTCATLGSGGVGANGCSGAYTDGAFLNASIGYGNYNAGFRLP